MEIRFENVTNRVKTILLGYCSENGHLIASSEYMGRERGYDVTIKAYDDIIDIKFYNGTYMIPTTQLICNGKIAFIPNNEYVKIEIM